MNKALDARTLGEIDELMADLPAIDLYQLPASSLRRNPPGTRQSLVPQRPASPARFPPGTAAIAAWAAVTLALGALWVVTAVLGHFWFPWWALIAAPWFWALIRRSRHGRE